jgi:hypothetical protein
LLVDLLKTVGAGVGIASIGFLAKWAQYGDDPLGAKFAALAALSIVAMFSLMALATALKKKNPPR